jgi:hypothetical protein
MNARALLAIDLLLGTSKSPMNRKGMPINTAHTTIQTVLCSELGNGEASAAK